jgi:hypothetical protein
MAGPKTNRRRQAKYRDVGGELNRTGWNQESPFLSLFSLFKLFFLCFLEVKDVLGNIVVINTYLFCVF